MWVTDEGHLEALESYVTKGALHSSLEREDSLYREPDTRQSILLDIEAWSQDLASPPILPLTGLVASGKTIILKEVANKVYQRAHLAGEFFFWRGDSECCVITTFVTTLVYHLGFILPSAALAIRETLNTNQAILQAPLEEQWEALIVQPLETLAGKPMSFRPLFIIDGLDECSSREDQLWVIEKMVQLCTRFPVGLLLSSRSEHHIRVAFAKYQGQFPSLFQPIIELADNGKVRQHIRFMLRPIYDALEGKPWDHEWVPSTPFDDTFETLVSDACGQMMFVAAIRHFRDITIPDYLRDHLKHLHSDGLLQAKAFSALDKRYDALMGAADSYLTVEQKALWDKIFYYLLYIQLDSVHAISIFWDTSPREIRSVLEQYHSVLRVPHSDKRPLGFAIHTFQGFLSSEHRGGKDAKYYIPKSSLSIDAFERCIHLAKHPGLHRTTKAPAYLFSLWLRLEPQLDQTSIRSKWMSKRRVLRILEGFDMSEWVSQWYISHKNEEFEQAYKEFRGRIRNLSKSTLKKFDENALQSSDGHPSDNSLPGFLVQLLRKLFPKWISRTRFRTPQ